MRITKAIPSQGEVNPLDPEEHFVWALRNLPSFGGVGMVTHSYFLRMWSKHLWECGFSHRDYLASLADEDGNIHVDKLPEQQIRFQEPFRGPHHQYNNAARWVKKDDPDPAPVKIPNIRDLTIQEQHALLYQFQREGMIPEGPIGPAMADVEDRKDTSNEQATRAVRASVPGSPAEGTHPLTGRSYNQGCNRGCVGVCRCSPGSTPGTGLD